MEALWRYTEFTPNETILDDLLLKLTDTRRSKVGGLVGFKGEAPEISLEPPVAIDAHPAYMGKLCVVDSTGTGRSLYYPLVSLGGIGSWASTT
jgi:hypothetical protein